MSPGGAASMKRLLIVCPFFPPANGADCHRARVLLPHFSGQGWDAEVLAVDPAFLDVPMDPWLVNPNATTPIHRCKALSLRWSFLPGLGTLTYRAKTFVKRAGSRLIAARNYDLIYFTTTAFSLMTLGHYWKSRFGVPYVVDYQDPWITNYYREHPDVIPPGGRLKYGIVEWLSRREEPKVVCNCAGFTAVSPDYANQLRARYACFRAPEIVLPFPGSTDDFERIHSEDVQQTVFDPADGLMHWVSMGVSGPIMFKALNSLFGAIAHGLKSGTLSRNLRLHFIGTSYAPAGKGTKVVQPLAEQFGLGDIVHEQTDRVPYSTALKCLLDANAIIATGSNDATYNASKLLPYLLARKPFLTIFHKDSPASELLTRLRGATCVSFDSNDSSEAIGTRIEKVWIQEKNYDVVRPLDAAALHPYTATGQAQLLCDFFDSALARAKEAALGS